VGIRCADHVTPSTRKSRHYFADSGGRSVGIVRLRTKATELIICLYDGMALHSLILSPQMGPLYQPRMIEKRM
jgi:hypothetical protein